MLESTTTDKSISNDDLKYVIDLGLVRHTDYRPQIANPIYREIIPRQLTTVIQENIQSIARPAWYILPDGRLDMKKLMTEFQQFFRENSESWLAGHPYHEAGPQLLLQAYLQRVINGGGTIDKGLKRTWEYMDRCGAVNGHLVIFDRAKKKIWQDKIFKCMKSYEDAPITIWGM